MAIKDLKINTNCVNRTLPLAFDESLSYLEMLCSILDKLNETINQVNINTEVAEHYEEILSEIEAELNRLEQEYEEFKTHIEQEIDEKFVVIQTALTNYVETQIAILRYEIDTKYNELDKKIDDVIAGDINVYDPTTGLLSPIQTVINNLFDLGRENAITATEFDGLELTATEFDAIEITAYNFDVNGKSLIPESI